MSVEDHFTQSYREGNPPSDIGKPDFNLVQTVTTLPIHPCKALEIGCGTGDNAVWLAQHGFEVVGVDAAKIAIERAKQKAADANVRCGFSVQDFLSGHVEGASFGFAFDRGCFHTVDSDEDRTTFAKQVHRHLGDGGLWLSVIGNADDELADEGPPRRTAREIVKAVEPYFEILSLVSSHFETKLPEPPRAWVCLMRKRPVS
jgi:methyl halide transferase